MMKHNRVDDDVLQVLIRASCEGCELRLTEQLDRALYQRVNKVLDLMGGVWNRKAKAHVFSEDFMDALADVIATGSIVDPKKEFQFFETPPDVATLLVDMADLPERSRVLEPSAGKGAIARVLHAHGHEVDVCEKWDKNREHLRFAGFNIVSDDFFNIVNGRYDAIVQNPPFSRGLDEQHFLHALPNVNKRGGTVASIMSVAWKFSTRRSAEMLRQMERSGAVTWTELPKDSFRASGTGVNTGIMIARFRR